MGSIPICRPKLLHLHEWSALSWQCAFGSSQAESGGIVRALLKI